MATHGMGVKHDGEKLRWDLLPIAPVREIIKVLAFGAEKYAPGNWMRVPDARNRYYAALMRHVTAWWEGEKIDKDSECHHLACAGCCLLFLLWFDLTGKWPDDEVQ